MIRWLTLLGVTLPALVLAAVGVSHPHELTPDTAQWWTDLHVLLIPVFPLLGVSLWILLHRERGVIAWVARVAAFVYMTFYGGLDALAGIATGTLMRQGADSPGTRQMLFDIGNDLGRIGAWSFLVACVATAIVAWLRSGRAALPGGLILVASSLSFLDSHIYWPRGVVTMLGLAVGFGLLALTKATLTTSVD